MYALVAIDLGESCKLGESYTFDKSCNIGELHELHELLLSRQVLTVLHAFKDIC